jgi:hypothetical protein
MKTYVQPWICKVKGEAETALLIQSTEKVLQVSETEITDSNQILSKENSLFFDLWENWEEADGVESE